MKKLYVIALAMLSGVGFAQIEKDLIGKWEFESVEKYTGEPDERELIESILEGYSVQLNEDHLGAITIMERPIIGNWNFDGQSKKVELKAANGKVQDFVVLSADQSRLKIRQNDQLEIALKKVDADLLEMPAIPVTMAATSAQVTGKWNLIGIEFDGKMVPMKDAFMQFHAKGNYSDKIMGMKGEGKWELLEEDGVHYLVTNSKSGPKRYFILDISDAALKLATPGKDGSFVFTKSKS